MRCIMCFPTCLKNEFQNKKVLIIADLEGIIGLESLNDFSYNNQLLETELRMTITVLRSYNFSDIYICNIHNNGMAYDKSLKLLAEVERASLVNLNELSSIIGKNGSGKTTLLNILAALNITSKGNIYFNDISINDIAYESMQESITYYTQDDILFDQSIKDNILSFKNGNEVSSEALQDICMRLGILDDIFNLDDGFDTLLSEYKTLSLGQKKKLLFARAFLKPSQVLLLDEPLSGLDKLSQGIVLNMIEELKGKKTIIIATHRPELFSFCDKMINI